MAGTKCPRCAKLGVVGVPLVIFIMMEPVLPINLSSFAVSGASWHPASPTPTRNATMIANRTTATIAEPGAKAASRAE